MLEQSAGIIFFLKTPKNKSIKIRSVYLRITVDGVPKETSIKRKWDVNRWDQKTERATGTKEDARVLNFYLDSLTTKINQYKTDLINNEVTITSQQIIDYVTGNIKSKTKVLEEFQAHNDEIKALIPNGEYSEGTHERYVTARSHVREYIQFKYKKDDLEFRELNYEFVKDYEFYLKTVRACNNNTTLKYISNFKKIVLRAVKKEIIPKDPFQLFAGKKTKTKKKPLTTAELASIETKVFSTERLSVIRDIFVFQCYTGLAYIDVFKLKKEDIRTGEDGNLWIMSNREKTDSNTDIPLLPKAIALMEKYKNDPLCIQRGSILPVRSNQKMNAYLKEIQVLCNINPKIKLDTHRARRTFASTVTLKNGVPIHIVKEMLGHQSVTQTEEYAITEQEQISSEMMTLKEKLSTQNAPKDRTDVMEFLQKLESELNELKKSQRPDIENTLEAKLDAIEKSLNDLKVAVH